MKVKAMVQLTVYTDDDIEIDTAHKELMMVNDIAHISQQVYELYIDTLLALQNDLLRRVVKEVNKENESKEVNNL